MRKKSFHYFEKAKYSDHFLSKICIYAQGHYVPMKETDTHLALWCYNGEIERMLLWIKRALETETERKFFEWE
jgi:hypothetical protein